MALDHNKKYINIDGHPIEMSFTKEPNTELYGRIRDILLGYSSQTCSKDNSSVKSKAKRAREDVR